MANRTKICKYLELQTIFPKEMQKRRFLKYIFSICYFHLSHISKINYENGTSADWLNARLNTESTTFFDATADIERANPEDFIHLFDSSEQLIDFLEHLLNNTSDCSQMIYNTLVRVTSD